ncbi:Hsp20/alpha crystallin family protein [Halovivax gelatinilyticus]|uniref:Hsp20/alpha crystallin family protein n=1 Tax=Halovivax gelatinilyticus TaxID=2961597 RepID=UPI0020CA7799|nr:Hsp20/alpha crystallin family protein [Halovivax gelatinilyticus]
MRRNPFEDLEDLFDRLSTQFEEGMARDSGLTIPGQAGVDVADTGEEYVVTADLPGYETDDIDLRLIDGALKLEASRDAAETHEEGDYIRRERTQHTVSRRVRLPDPVDEEGIGASYNNGVLTVTLPKLTGETGGHQIDIS